MRRLGYLVVDYLVADLERLSESRVSRRHEAADFAVLHETLPRSPSSFEDCLRFFDQHAVPGLTRVNHPRFHAYLPSAGSWAGSLGSFLAAGLNSFVGSWLGGGSMSTLELVVLEWLAQSIGYPSDGSGILTSGGSIANLTGLAAARATAEGPLSQATVYVSDHAHASCEKAVSILGITPGNLRRVACDSAFRLDPRELRRRIDEDRNAGLAPLAVCASAGTTNTGAVDPLAETASLCAERDVWLHVDGAYGGFAAMNEGTRPLFDGMEQADSLALDPHKWLYAPMGVGCVLFRSRGAAERAFRAAGDYLRDTQNGDQVNFFDRGPELSRPARALSVWFSLRSAGIDKIQEEIAEDLRLAQLASRLLIENRHLELVAATVLSVVTFRFKQDTGSIRAQRLMESTLEAGTTMLSTTELDGLIALRFVVMNHRSSEVEIRRSVREIHEHVDRIVSRSP